MTVLPSPAPLTSKERRALLLWLLAALTGLFIVVRYHDAAFPSASIDFQITRTEAEAAAADFLRRQGFDPSPYRAVTTFDYDDDAKVYLERALGLEAANRLMASGVPVWRWETRFFIPLQQEEFAVSLSPSGRLVGFDHEIEEQREGAALTQAQAREIAERFLTGTQTLNLAGYRLVEGETVTRDHRNDHTFTWERAGFKAADAAVRLAVTVQGDRVGGYSEYLKVPEAWQRDYARLRSRNALMQQIAEAGLLAFIIAVLVAFVQALSRKRMTWRFSVRCGIALAVTSLALTLNTLPLTLSTYQTTQSLGGFYGIVAFGALLGAAGWFLAISLIGAVGVAGYRELLPDKIAPEWLLSRKTVQGDEVVRTGAFFKPPEAWVRAQQETTVADILVMAATVLGFGVVVVAATRLYVMRIREHEVAWRFSLAAAGILAGMNLIGLINGLSTFYAAYQTTMSLESYIAMGVIRLAMTALIQGGLAGAALTGFAETLYRLAHAGRPDLRTWFRETLTGRSPHARVAIRNALMLSYTACLIAPGVRHLLDLGGQALELPSGREAAAPPYISSYAPEIGILLDALSSAVIGGALLLGLVLLGRHYLRRTRYIVLAFLALAVLLQAADAVTLPEFAFGAARQAVILGVAWLGIRYAWRDNLLAYALTLFLIPLTQDAWAMIQTSSEAYRMAGFRAMALAALPVLLWGKSVVGR